MPLLAALADQFDTTTASVKDMVSAGEVGFEDVRQAFITMTSEGGLFFDLMETKSETTGGRIQNLGDAMLELKAAIGDALAPIVKDFVEDLTVLLDKLRIFAEENPGLVKAVFALGIVLGGVGTAIIGIATALLILAPIALVFGITIGALSGIIGLIILAIIALIAIGVFLAAHWEELEVSAREVWSQIKNNISQNINAIEANLKAKTNLIKAQWTATWLDMKKTTDDVWFRISDRVLTTIAGIRKRITANLSLIKARWKSDWNLIKRITDDVLFRISDKVLTNIVGIKRTITANLNLIKAIFRSVLDSVQAKVSGWADAVKGFFDTVKGAVESLIGALKSLVSASSEDIGKVGGALGFQHGGVVPGAFNQPVPIIAHGGERVIPKTGTDVNPLAGGRGPGGGGITINIEGDVNSTEMLERIIEAVKGALGRENELANQGLAT